MPLRALSFKSALTLCGLLLAGGCSVFEDDVQAGLPCPEVITVFDAQDLTRFVGDGRDLTDVDFTVRIADVLAACDYDDEEIENELQISFVTTRGPANDDGEARYRYFVAVAQSGDPPRVLAREAFAVETQFAESRRRALETQVVLPRIPLRAAVPEERYRIYVGLALTPSELEYNRQNR